jgi:hypothetical protein
VSFELIQCPKKCGAMVYRVSRPGGVASFDGRKLEERSWRSFGSSVFKAAAWHSDTDPAVEYRGVHRC